MTRPKNKKSCLNKGYIFFTKGSTELMCEDEVGRVGVGGRGGGGVGDGSDEEMRGDGRETGM